MNKKGLEIGINFLIILILVIVIFGFGFAIFTRLFERTSDFQNTVDQSTQKQLDQLLDSGEPVSVPRTKATIYPNDGVIFHIGINNEIEESSGTEFVLMVKQVTSSPEDFVIEYDKEPFVLLEGERKYMPFKIEAPGSAPKNTYIFNVAACYPGTGSGDTLDPQDPCEGLYPKIYYALNKIYLNVR